MKLKDTAFHSVDRSLMPEDIASLPRPSRRITEVLLKGSLVPIERASKSWALQSCLSPKHFLADAASQSSVASTELDVMQLEAPSDPNSKVRRTGCTKILPSNIVFRSVGYKSTPLDGFAGAGIQFDKARGVVDNDGLGRVIGLVSSTNTDEVATRQVPGIYCAGWVKRGPTGVIASTMSDAFMTGDAIVHDWLSGATFLNPEYGHVLRGWDAVKQELGPEARRAVNWDQWRRIDRAEKQRGRRVGKERDKFTSTAEMLNVLG